MLPAVPSRVAEELSVVRPVGAGVTLARVPAVLLPVDEALTALARARVGPDGHRAAAFWGAAALLALHCVARGLLLPGLSPQGHDAWRIGPLNPEDAEQVRRLAASMPPEAHAVPVDETRPLRLPEPERLLRAFLDAVADALPRSPAAPLLTAGPAYAARQPRYAPELRAWAGDVAAGHDAGVRISLRIEVSGLDTPGMDDRRAGRPATDPSGAGGTGAAASGAAVATAVALRAAGAVTDARGVTEPGSNARGAGGVQSAVPAAGHGAAPRFRAVPQVHSVSDPALVVDAAEIWTESGVTHEAFGPRARMDALLALRRAARAWPALTPLLSATVPDAVELVDEEVTELLDEGSLALAGAGIEVHWPRALARTLTARAVVGPHEEERGPTGSPRTRPRSCPRTRS